MTTLDRRHFFDQLRARIRLSEIVSRQVKLIRRGREYTGLCPFHTEKSPSFTVNDQKSFYHCFGCGAHGDALKFLMEIEKYSYREALEELAQKAGLEVPQYVPSKEAERFNNDFYSIVEETVRYFEGSLQKSPGAFARDYLEKRGMTPSTISKFRLGFSPDTRYGLLEHLKSKKFPLESIIELGLGIQPEGGKAPYDRFRGRLMFPIFNFQEKPVAFGGRILGEGEPKYLNSPENPLFHKGSLLFNFPNARKSQTEPLLIVEGYMDVIAMDQAGFGSVVAPMGTALTEEQIQLAWRLDPQPIICFDGDLAGQKAALRAADRALPLLKAGHTLRFAFLPKGQDPDSLLRQGQRKVFENLIAAPMPLVDLLWKTLIPAQGRLTPENIALLEKRIDEEVNKIEDDSLKQHFRYDLRGRFFTEYSSKNKRDKNNEAKKLHNSNLLLNSSSNFYIIQQKLLLATVVNHPHILREVVEDLANLEIQDEQMQNLRDDLLSGATDETNESTQALKDFLILKGHQDALTILASETLLTHGAFARESSELEEARRGWQEVYYHHLERKRLEEEIELATKSLAEAPSQEVWDQVKALKEALIQLSLKE
ncbi:DNA primase [Candidatus Bealeia paramacronuclearis]|uniref:DNA primase n=1 Tax=Candidatus Bealeia paramacronuclearis TaxID=1921001 RepID=A0ABZ2C3Q7_9PROT|nr:DNA primase [Candidatus Bealeia paramacronuclearis]